MILCFTQVFIQQNILPCFAEAEPKPKIDILAENLTDHEKYLKSIGYTESDKRPTAVASGVMGAIFVIVTVLLIVGSDVPLLKTHFQYFRENLKDCFWRLQHMKCGL